MGLSNLVIKGSEELMKKRAHFLSIERAMSFCDNNPTLNLIIQEEWGYFIVYEA